MILAMLQMLGALVILTVAYFVLSFAFGILERNP